MTPVEGTAPSLHSGGGGRNVTLFLLGYAVSVMGDQVFYLALAWYALALAESDLVAGLVVSIGALPRAILLLPAGAFADGRGFRRVAVRASFLRMVVLGALAVACGDRPVPMMGALLAAALLFGCIEAFYLPSSQSMVTTVSSEDTIERIQPLFSGIQRLGVVAGPLLGGALLGFLSPRMLFSMLAVVSLVSLACLLMVREQCCRTSLTDGRPLHTLGTRMLGSVKRILANSVLRPCLVLIVLAEFAASGLTNTGYAMLATARAWDGFQLGQVLACYGAGAAVAACLMALVAPQRAEPHIGRGIVVAGLGFAAAGATSSHTLASLLSVAAGLGSGVGSTLLVTRFITQARGSDTATAISVMSLASFGAAPLSSLYCGFVAWIGAPSAVFISLGAVLVTVGAWFSLRNHVECIE